MVISGFIGTVLGKQFLVKMNGALFHRVLAIILTILALRLLVIGLIGLSS